MAPPQDTDQLWDLPILREVHHGQNVGDFWSIAFYPYTAPGVDPVFAAVGGKHIMIGRISTIESESIDWIQVIIDENSENNAGNYACTWSKDISDGTPWLCVTGFSGQVRVINALTGKTLRTIIGHGGEILEIATCPANPQIIATGCEDTSIRLWNLGVGHTNQPCVAILQGEGHRSDVQSIDFHITGNYLLSGGIDRTINVWTIPARIIHPDKNFHVAAHANPLIIHYPHFSTSDVSHEIVDCVAFHGDLVLCKSVHTHIITLFSITGFTSSAPLPAPETAPTAHDTTKTTRSAFVKIPIISSDSVMKESQQTASEPPQLFTRLLSFAIPGADVLFTRFSISPPSTGRSILAYANRYSKIMFWDLERLTTYYDWSGSSPRELAAQDEADDNETTAQNETVIRKDRPPFLAPYQRRPRPAKGADTSQESLSAPRKRGRPRIHRSPSPTTSSRSLSTHEPEATTIGTSSARPSIPPAETTSHPATTIVWRDYDPITGKKNIDWEESRRLWERQYEMRDAFKGIEAHKEVTLKGMNLTGRKLAWSVDGQWCVCVGSQGYIALLQNKVSSVVKDIAGKENDGGESVLNDNGAGDDMNEDVEL